jgi:clan AA aspartic protease
MMTGIVTSDREATLRVIVHGPTGQEQVVDAVVDTGFNGFLTLPNSLITLLDLPYYGQALAMLGDGGCVSLGKYKAAVIWDGREREVLVLEADGGALIGMSLLYGSRMILDVVEGGRLSIETSPGREAKESAMDPAIKSVARGTVINEALRMAGEFMGGPASNLLIRNS